MTPTQREAQARAKIAALGLQIYRRGAAWQIVGPGVDILTIDLSHVADIELLPARGYAQNKPFHQPPKGNSND